MDLYKNLTIEELLELNQTLKISELSDDNYFDLENRVKSALAGDLGVLNPDQTKVLEEFSAYIEFDWTEWRYEDIRHRAKESKLGVVE